MSDVPSPRCPFVFYDGSTNVSLRGKKETVRLRPRHYEVLEYLSRSVDQLVGQDTLYRALWPPPRPDRSIVTVTVCHLRQSLRRLGNDAERHIECVWGIGYMLSSEAKWNDDEARRDRAAWKKMKEVLPEEERFLLKRMDRLAGE